MSFLFFMKGSDKVIDFERTASEIIQLFRDIDYYEYMDTVSGNEVDIYMKTMEGLICRESREQFRFFFGKYRDDCFDEEKTRIDDLMKVMDEIDQKEIEVSAFLINNFCKKEYGQEADVSDPELIGIAYSNTEDEKHEIQVYANTKNYTITKCVDGIPVEGRKYRNFLGFASDLKEMEFSDLVSIGEPQIQAAEKLLEMRERSQYEKAV